MHSTSSETAGIKLEDANRFGFSASVEKGVAEAIQLRLGKIVTCPCCCPLLLVERNGCIGALCIDHR